MSFISDIRDKLVRKVATSFLLRFCDGHKTEIARIVQAVNMLIAALYLALPVLDAKFGSALSQNLDFINDKWLLALNALTHLGLEFGLADAKAKEKLGIKK
jgi:hypothetical protein